MKARMDSQQVRLDSLEDLLDVMAVGNPVMQRMLNEKNWGITTSSSPVRKLKTRLIGFGAGENWIEELWAEVDEAREISSDIPLDFRKFMAERMCGRLSTGGASLGF
ncbi:hypothetical protein DY000_02025526 [Brassica cretica]|uniref:Uncharacterized protein n=1 Tax=Brassica cretica TaxID=69181 RepID=A0ABQ7ECL6_BRACR|nr:hypothetical protein DY000_02025526 [Brassica cretica]